MVSEEFRKMESYSDGGRAEHSMALKKIESILQNMQNDQNGVSTKTVKGFAASLPDAFAGCDFVSWLMENLAIEDRAEAVHLAHLFCHLGYVYSTSDGKATLKDDHALYRFQTPYFWPSVNLRPDYIEYAIYLTKRSLRNKQKHGLDENEQYDGRIINSPVAFTLLDKIHSLSVTGSQMALAKLRGMLCDKWDFIHTQAQEQVRLLKERKKADKHILTSQEKAFWKIQTSLPNQINGLELEKNSRCQRSSPLCHSIDTATKQVKFLEASLNLPRIKTSKTAESMISRCGQYREHDPFIVSPLPSNPWITDDTSMWSLDAQLTEAPTERRMRRWSFGLGELLRDPSGLRQFQCFLEKEFSAENIRFWTSVEQMKLLPQSQMKAAADEIFKEFLAPGAPSEINIDSQTMAETNSGLENPTRQMYDRAVDHIFHLMKKDSYPRFLRSDQYKDLLRFAQQTTMARKKVFSLGSKKHNKSQVSRIKRRGSTSRVANHTQADDMPGTTTATTLSQHSYSTGNLIDMDSLRSGKSTPFGSSGSVGDDPNQSGKRFSPANLRRKLEDFFLSPLSSPHRTKLEVPQQHGTQADPLTLVNEDCAVFTVNISVPSPNSENVVAPWEDSLKSDFVGNAVKTVVK